MSVTVVKQKNKSTATTKKNLQKMVAVGPGVELAQDVVQSLVDSKKDVDQINEKLKQARQVYGKVEKIVLGEVEAANVPPEDELRFSFGDNVIALSKAGNETAITASMKEIHALLDKIKPGLFYELCGVGLTDLRAYLTPDQFASITETNASGKRRVSVK